MRFQESSGEQTNQMWQAIYRGDSQGLLNGLLIKVGLVDPNHPLAFAADPEPFLGIPAVLWWILFIAIWGGVSVERKHH